MEFVNPYKRYRDDVINYCSTRDKEALTKEYSSSQLAAYVHTTDNYFIDTSYGRTCKQLREQHYGILGISLEAPWPHNGSYCAIVFTDDEDVLWCHINEIILNWWKEQVQNV